MSLEVSNVHSVYDKIAEHFDHTRFALWDGVVSWLNKLPSGSSILDVGCGNGKYLSVRRDDCVMHACDPCVSLVHIAASKHPLANIVVANGLALPYGDAMFDAVMSIAVFHHLSTDENRQQYVRELHRVLKPGGKMLVTMWSTDALKPSWQSIGDGDYLVPWHDVKTDRVYDRYYHLFTKKEVVEYFPDCGVRYERDNWFAMKTT